LRLTQPPLQGTRKAFAIFKQNPFDPRLRSHKIQKLSARYARVIYAAEIEADLRLVFYVRRCSDDGGHRFARSVSLIVCYAEREIESPCLHLNLLTAIFVLAAEAGLRPDQYHVGFGARPGR